MIPHLDGLGLLLILTGVLGLLGLVPLPGVDSTHNISYNGTNAELHLVDQQFLGEHDGLEVLGTHNMVSDRIEIATDNHGLLRFLSVCSHEVKHFKFDVEDRKKSDPLIESEEHELMGNTFLPWNWESSCVNLVPERMNFL